MGLKVQVDFLAGATVGIRAYIYDEDDALVDPTSAKVSTWDPDGTAVLESATMTALADTDGIYEYFYNTDSDTATGLWRGQVEVVDGSGATAKTTLAPFSFRIK
jgi:uncharacterized protein YfaS (alpha-2-macroglobulin family)